MRVGPAGTWGFWAPSSLFFLVSHMQTFWYKMHFGEMPMHDGLKDLHTVVLAFFSPENSLGILAVLGYVLAQMALAFHLVHGFQSGFPVVGIAPSEIYPCD
jgi:succinate dehydrogenase / fumarate reductase cytochrome b subunit